MKTTYLLLILSALTITAGAQMKNNDKELYQNKALENFGMALLESLKSSDTDKLLALGLTIEEFKKTVQAKTNEEFKNKFIAEVANENDNEIKKMIIVHFETLTQIEEIDWIKAKYTGFEFRRQKNRSDKLGFDWGKGILSFTADEKGYEISVSEMSQMISGWKGVGFRLAKKSPEIEKEN